MQHFSMKEIIRSLPKEKNRKSSWWVKLFIRRISFLFTWFFINIGCSANLVSIISVFIVLLGVIFMAMSNIFFVSMGVILLEFWLVLDCVDGNIARVKKTNSYMGEFFDALSGYAMSCFSLFGIGIAAFHYSSILFGKENEICIILGGLGSLCIMYARLIYQRYSNYCTMTEKKVFGSSTYQPDNYSYSIEDKKRTINFYFIYVEKQFGMSGLFMPLLIVSCIFRVFDFLLVIYSFYNFITLIGIFLIYSKKAVIFNTNIKKKLLKESTINNEKIQ